MSDTHFLTKRCRQWRVALGMGGNGQ